MVNEVFALHAVDRLAEAGIAAVTTLDRGPVALYVGGMGHRNKNFHNDMMVRRGYPEAAQKIQELYLAGRKREAMRTLLWLI